MSELELAIRAAGATAAVILAAAIARVPTASRVGPVCGALLCLGVAVYLPCSASSSLCSSPASIPLAFLASAIPFFFWAWSRAVMDEEFHLSVAALLAGLLLAIIPIVAGSMPRGRFVQWGVIAHSLLGIVFIALALAEVVRGWRQDLIEARRRLRLALLVICGGYTIAVLGVELFLQSRPATDALQLLNATLLASLLLALATGLLSVSGPLRSALGWNAEPPAPDPSVTQPAPVTARDLDEELIAKLHTLMTGNAMYRDAELSIALLASQLGVQEKRLREVINRRLGHKNFPSYVNAFRLEEVRLRLANASEDKLPILTLALDAGFGSIVAFNRAFKDRYAATPSEYRANRKPCLVER